MVGAVERQRVLSRIREICLGLPETSERLSHGAPTFFVRDKRAFLMVLTNHRLVCSCNCGCARFKKLLQKPGFLQLTWRFVEFLRPTVEVFAPMSVGAS